MTNRVVYQILQKVGIITGFIFILSALILSIAYGFTVGNAIALCVGTVLIAFGIWFKKLSMPLQKTIIALAGFGLILFLIVTAVIIARGMRNTATFDEDSVLVLGCGIRGEALLPTLRARLDKCMEYYAENPNAPIVVSGGRGSKEDITEALAMKRYLVENGVDETKIVMEDKSRNTKENMLNSKQILDEYFGGKTYSMVCITSDYHAYRAQKVAENCGLNTRSFNAGVKWYLRPSAYCREVISVCKYQIFE